MPHLEATFRAHGDHLAVFAVDVGVNDPIEDVRELVASKQLAVPVAVERDGSVAAQFRLNVTPQQAVTRYVPREPRSRAIDRGVQSAVAANVAPMGAYVIKRWRR